MRLVEQSGFDELNLEVDGMKLSLRRGASGNGVVESEVVGAVATPPPPLQRQTAPAPAAAPSSDPTLHDVPSPLLGTFYRSPKPGAPPFIDVGSTVEENTVVAIIEVMKLMNTVRAGVRGTITEVLLTDGALAEFGQPLFRVRKAVG
jgi:acetyl-CoA carboxylase biotin carboxyl carrier protein